MNALIQIQLSGYVWFFRNKLSKHMGQRFLGVYSSIHHWKNAWNVYPIYVPHAVTVRQIKVSKDSIFPTKNVIILVGNCCCVRGRSKIYIQFHVFQNADFSPKNKGCSLMVESTSTWTNCWIKVAAKFPTCCQVTSRHEKDSAWMGAIEWSYREVNDLKWWIPNKERS